MDEIKEYFSHLMRRNLAIGFASSHVCFSPEFNARYVATYSANVFPFPDFAHSLFSVFLSERHFLGIFGVCVAVLRCGALKCALKNREMEAQPVVTSEAFTLGHE